MVNYPERDEGTEYQYSGCSLTEQNALEIKPKRLLFLQSFPNALIGENIAGAIFNSSADPKGEIHGRIS